VVSRPTTLYLTHRANKCFNAYTRYTTRHLYFFELVYLPSETIRPHQSICLLWWPLSAWVFSWLSCFAGPLATFLLCRPFTTGDSSLLANLRHWMLFDIGYLLLSLRRRSFQDWLSEQSRAEAYCRQSAGTVGPVAIYLLDVETFVFFFPSLILLNDKEEGLDFFSSSSRCFLTTP
jgi:hypothetical protein